MRTLVGIAHWAVDGGGIVLLWCSLFLYETEAGQIENTLDRWWRDAEVLRKQTGSAYAAFMQTVAVQTDRLLTKICGRDLLSRRFLVVSICATIAAVNIVLQAHKEELSLQRTGAVVLAFGMIALASDYLGARLWPAIAFVAVTVASLAYQWLWWYYFQRGPMASIVEALRFFTFGTFAVPIIRPVAAILVLSVACNVLIVAIARWSVRLMASADTFVGISRLILVSAIVPACFVAAPVMSPFMAIPQLGTAHSDTRLAIVYTGYANVYAGSVFALYLTLALVMLLHHAFWGLVQRPLYAVGRKFHVFRQNKTLFSLGIALLGIRHQPVAKAVADAVAKSGLF